MQLMQAAMHAMFEMARPTKPLYNSQVSQPGIAAFSLSVMTKSRQCVRKG
jgi:hypothetical protein